MAAVFSHVKARPRVDAQVPRVLSKVAEPKNGPQVAVHRERSRRAERVTRAMPRMRGEHTGRRALEERPHEGVTAAVHIPLQCVASDAVFMINMRTFLVHWLVTGVALAVTAYVVPGIQVTSGFPLVLGALVLGLVNAIVRPVLVLLTLPLTVVTLGLFYLVVNGIAFGLAAALVPGFAVRSFGSAILGALVMSLISWAIGWLLTPRD